MFEPVQTVGTLVGLLSCVNPQMGQEVELSPEPAAALLALERQLPSVSSLVAAELLVGQEGLRTETTGFGVFLPVVSLLVDIAHSFSVECLATLRTHKLL